MYIYTMYECNVYNVIILYNLPGKSEPNFLLLQHSTPTSNYLNLPGIQLLMYKYVSFQIIWMVNDLMTAFNIQKSPCSQNEN